MSYVSEIRKKIGNDLLIGVGSGVIIEQRSKILLQKRADGLGWGIHAGGIEVGESFEAAAHRELFEESGLIAHSLEFFGTYSGEDSFLTYPNGDEIYFPTIVYVCRDFSGELKAQQEEVAELSWFDIHKPLPEPLFSMHARLLKDFVAKELKDELYQ
ncbi:NUDIX hydrolase [Lactococcus kimchii]|uniref:NUDIX hydrolase n=1 Tax=Lactococcus sp. S-13 TaxID=2507158 RepID=UPI0010237FC1|nr:NUDIX domain-containing protein [Lactococcus sp. S-13]RZI48857.1 NUDIX domain-containing protein [Lactococcus sp. S-13]